MTILIRTIVSDDFKLSIRNEINQLKNHETNPLVVDFIDAYYETEGSSRFCYIYMEFMDGERNFKKIRESSTVHVLDCYSFECYFKVIIGVYSALIVLSIFDFTP